MSGGFCIVSDTLVTCWFNNNSRPL